MSLKFVWPAPAPRSVLSTTSSLPTPVRRATAASSRTVGTYNPMLAKDRDKRVVLDTERAQHWLSVGAQPTDRVCASSTLPACEARARATTRTRRARQKAQERAEPRAASRSSAPAQARAEEASRAE